MSRKRILLFSILAVIIMWPISILTNHLAVETNIAPPDKYIKNLLVMTSLNNYFFGNNPQVDMTELNHRTKFPYIAMVPFLVGVYLSVKNKKHFKLWLIGLVIVLFISLFKSLDGWDFAMYPIIGIITIDGLKEIAKYKYGWIVLILISVISLTEIGRLII